MGTMRKYKVSPDPAGQTKHLVIVPGISNKSLAKQTCEHFETWINECSAIPKTVWIFDHGVDFKSDRPLDQFCSAGSVLLKELLKLSQIEDASLTLVGHRLGAFVLKQSLILAHRNNHHKEEDALFAVIQTLIMIGDPVLQDDNRADWCSLVSGCLQTTTKTWNMGINESALKCLTTISDQFEDIIIHSHFFQVSGQAFTRSRMPLKLRSQHKQCVCNPNVSARIWSTATEDTWVPGAAGNQDRCVFHPGSTHNKALLSIANDEFNPAALLGHSKTSKSAIESALPSTPSIPTTVTKEEEVTSSLVHSTGVSCDQIGQDTSEDIAASGTSSMVTERQETAECSETGQDLEEDSKDTNTSGDSDTPSPKEELFDQQRDLETQPATASLIVSQAAEAQIYGPDARALAEDNDVSKDERVAFRPRKLPVMLDVPPAPPYFVGRPEILNTLNSCLLGNSKGSGTSTELESQRVAVLYGVGGVGKTAVASEAVRRMADTFDHIIWLRSESPPSIRQSVHEVALVLGLIPPHRVTTHAESKRTFDSWLETTTSSWLLVFDGCDELSTIGKYLPSLPRGFAIVTSRCVDFSKLERPNRVLTPITVPCLSLEEGAEFFAAALSAPKDDTETEERLLAAKSVQGHPLALNMLLPLLERGERITLSAIADRSAELTQASTSTSTSSKEGLQANVSPLLATMANLEHLSEPAAALCAVLSFLDPDEIEDCLPLGAQNIPNLHIAGFPIDDDSFIAAKSDCIRSRILWPKNESAVSAHRFCTDSIRHTMAPERQRVSFDTARLLVSARWPSKRRLWHCLHGPWPEFDRLYLDTWSLACNFLELAQRLRLGENEVTTSLLRGLARLLIETTWYNTKIRGNVGEDPGLIRLAHEIFAVLQDRSLQISAPKNPYPPRLPNRLVQINHDLKTWKVVEFGKQQLPYAAISYVWDDVPAIPICTKATLHEYSVDQPLSLLPVFFGNAIDYSARCGIDHFWIDQLCIVQDDEEERMGEITNMADIFTNASFTIASTLSAPELGPLSLPGWHNSSQELPGLGIQVHGHCNQTWVVQERLLCERVLYSAKPSSYLNLRPENVLSSTDRGITDALADRDKFLFECVPFTSDIILDENKAGNATVSKHTDEASLAVAEGIKYYEDGDLVRSAAKFINARDSLSVSKKSTYKASNQHLTYSTYLGIAWLGQKLPAEAIEMLDRALDLYNLEDNVTRALKPNLILAQFNITSGDAHLMLGDMYQASEAYSRAASFVFPDDKETEDLFAILQLKRSDIHMRNSEYTKVDELITIAIDHFENQDSPQGQAQLARALYKQALAFEAQQKNKRSKRSMKRSRDELLQYYDDLDEAADVPEQPTEDDFRRPLRFGYR